EFEQRYAITLPPDYRAFLQEIGNGGAGPYYGIPTLGDPALPFQAESDPTLLAKPFPLTARVAVLSASAEGLSPDEYYARIEDDEEYWERVQECVGDYNAPEYHQGTILVGDYGCGIAFLLVVSGDERGHVWIDDLINDGGYFPLSASEDREAADTRVGFLA